ncbi:MAG TPA: hypothetical protein VN689_10170 [Burkholderiales bacterium]|jgi:hypothetical protein|nr:hypothetical protein [Burkholderiales bacterium]
MNSICSESIIGAVKNALVVLLDGNCNRLVPLMQFVANPERLKASQ